jgi:type VI protein secretion system component Hcp
MNTPVIGLRNSGWLLGLGLLGALGACTGRSPDKNLETASQALTGSFVISGLVSTSKGPTVGATVKLTGSESRTAFSDATGHYSIPGLGAGSYQVSASAGTSCASTAVSLNNIGASVTADLGMTGTGCASFVGVVGPTGPTGPAGPAGAQGKTGATGAQGPSGAAGPAGAQGIQGVQGAQGVPGTPGPAGLQGVAGPVGPQGPQGLQGPAGATGPQGPTGPSGTAVPPLTVIGTLTLGTPGDAVVTGAPIRTFSQQVSNSASAHSGAGSGTGTVTVSDIQISRDSDQQSPTISFIAAKAQAVETAQITLAGGALTIQLNQVFINQVASDSTQDGVPLEKLSLTFQSITWTYTSGGSSTTVSYDSDQGTGGGGGSFNHTFVFFGPGVDSSAFANQTPFSKLALQLTNSVSGHSGSGAGSGTATVSPLTLVTGVSAQTVAHLDPVVKGQPIPNATAHFTALAAPDQNGNVATVDRMRYDMAGTVFVTTVAIDTTPAGTLQETLGFDFSRITWTAQSLTGGPDVTQTFNIATQTAH